MSEAPEVLSAPLTEADKKPEQENRISMEPVTAHIALGAVDTKFFSPSEKTVTDEQKEQLKIKTGKDLEYKAMNNLSDESRRDYWKDSNKSFKDKNKDWNARTWRWVQRSTAEGRENRDTRIEALVAVGIHHDDNATDRDLNTQTEHFRSKYLEGGSDVKKFINDLSDGCESADGTIDIDKLGARIDAVKPLFRVFGVKDDVHKLVNDFADAHALLSQKAEEKARIVDQTVDAAKRPITDESQHNRLTALARKQKELDNTRQTPPPPDHPSPEGSTPPPDGSRGVLQEKTDKNGETSKVTFDDEKLLNMLLYPDNHGWLYLSLVEAGDIYNQPHWEQSEQMRAIEGMKQLLEVEFEGYDFHADTLDGMRREILQLQSDPNIKQQLKRHGRDINFQDTNNLDSLAKKGDFMHFGVNSNYSDAPDLLSSQARIYITPKQWAVGEITAEVIKRARNQGYEPYGKVYDNSTNNEGLNQRKDRILFSPRTESQLIILMTSISEIQQEHPDLFEDANVLVAERTAIPGVSFAEEPLQNGDDKMSFNDSRAAILDDVMKKTLDKLFGPVPKDKMEFATGRGGNAFDKRLVTLRDGINNGTFDQDAVMKILRGYVQELKPQYNIDSLHFAFNEGSTTNIENILSKIHTPSSPASAEQNGDGEQGEQEDPLDPDLLSEARREVILSKTGDISTLQQKLHIDNAMASRVMEQLSSEGLVGPENEHGSREVNREATGEAILQINGQHLPVNVIRVVEHEGSQYVQIEGSNSGIPIEQIDFRPLTDPEKEYLVKQVLEQEAE